MPSHPQKNPTLLHLSLKVKAFYTSSWPQPKFHPCQSNPFRQPSAKCPDHLQDVARCHLTPGPSPQATPAKISHCGTQKSPVNIWQNLTHRVPIVSASALGLGQPCRGGRISAGRSGRRCRWGGCPPVIQPAEQLLGSTRCSKHRASEPQKKTKPGGNHRNSSGRTCRDTLHHVARVRPMGHLQLPLSLSITGCSWP